VDARNPLLFRNVDLEKFIKEVDPKKGNLLLMNKADLLTVEQIQSWDEYFKSKGIDTIFW
jgi:large subunit GTPase 1